MQYNTLWMALHCYRQTSAHSLSTCFSQLSGSGGGGGKRMWRTEREKRFGLNKIFMADCLLLCLLQLCKTQKQSEREKEKYWQTTLKVACLAQVRVCCSKTDSISLSLKCPFTYIFSEVNQCQRCPVSVCSLKPRNSRTLQWSFSPNLTWRISHLPSLFMGIPSTLKLLIIYPQEINI